MWVPLQALAWDNVCVCVWVCVLMQAPVWNDVCVCKLQSGVMCLGAKYCKLRSAVRLVDAVVRTFGCLFTF